MMLWHLLRHGHASMVIHLGHSVAAVQHRLGYRKPDTIVRVYTHQWSYRDAQQSTIGEQLGTLLATNSAEPGAQQLREVGS